MLNRTDSNITFHTLTELESKELENAFAICGNFFPYPQLICKQNELFNK